MRQNIFDGKSWYSLPPPPPPLIHKIFRYQIFCETQKGSSTKFSALWGKKYSTEDFDTSSLSLIHKLFRYKKFFETQHRRVPLRNVSVLWNKENFDRKSGHNPLKHKFLRYPKLVTHWRVTCEMFRYCETKQFRRKIVIPPLLSLTFFDTRN